MMKDYTPEAMAALEAELAAVRAEMQEFSATVSHDLRAPLRHIVSYAQLVREEAGPHLDAEVQGFLTTIVDSARHMGTLLDGLTALSRVGTQPIMLEPVSLQELVQDVCVRLSGGTSGPTVAWHIGENLPTVRADVRMVRQVLEHVMENAVKFSTPREQPVVTINHVASDDEGYETLLVHDNGVGFNPAQQDKLFKVFGRLHSAQQFPGVGMGLALTRKLLGRMKGSVAVRAEVDAGCSVSLSFRSARSTDGQTP